MEVMILVCHPMPTSFNHAVAQRAAHTLIHLGHRVHFHDLYREPFNPVLSKQEILSKFSFNEQVQQHTQELIDSEGLIMVHPDWWGQPPALLKGWIDRVFRPGVAYEFEGEDFMRREKIPLLVGKKGTVFCTTHSSKEERPHILERLWKEAIFGYCGVEKAGFHMLYDVYNTDHARRTEWLGFVERTVEEWFPRQSR